MQEVVIRSFNQLQEEVFAGVWDPALRRYRDNRVYRGGADKTWGLMPSLNRACPHDLTLEKQMLRSFKKYGYADLPHMTSFWQVLAMAQQFGLPTRLLDWTYSPLVAAHFATEDVASYDRDGAIWCAEVEKINRGFVSRILNLTLLAPDIVEAILDGRQPKSLMLEDVARGIVVDWREQRGVVGVDL